VGEQQPRPRRLDRNRATAKAQGTLAPPALNRPVGAQDPSTVRQAELEDPDAWVAAQGETCGIGGPGRATERYLKGLTPELGTRVAHQFSAQERTDNDNFIECRSDGDQGRG
jgi:hypothetical protein